MSEVVPPGSQDSPASGRPQEPPSPDVARPVRAPLGILVAKLAYRLFMDMPFSLREVTNRPLQWAMGSYEDPHFNDNLKRLFAALSCSAEGVAAQVEGEGSREESSIVKAAEKAK